MRRLLLVVVGVLLLSLFALPAAFADGGPHGGYSSTGGAGNGLPDQCAACHRVHQGQSVGKLLKASSQYALCLTCHNGAGSKLDVLDGVKLGSTITPDSLVIRQADQGDITIAVVPDADLSVGAGGFTSFTIALRNRSSAITSVALAIADNNTTGTTGFFASVLTDTSVNVPAIVGTVPGVAYTRFTTKAGQSAVPGTQNLTTVTATITGGATAIVRVQSRVGASGSQFDTAVTLNGGGFRYISGAPVTSRHNADPADNTLYPWGFNANSGQNPNALSSPLQCTSCHNPHGTENYRLLKSSINSTTPVVRAYFNAAAATTTMSFMKDEGGPGIASTGGWQPSDKYTREYYGSAGGGGAPTTAGEGSIASLCGACHTAYPSAGAAIGYNVGGVTHYRHKTEMPYTDWSRPDPPAGWSHANPETAAMSGFPALRLASSGSSANTIVTCLTCHRVHGSASTMSGYALTQQFGGLGDNDLTPSQLTDATMPGGRSTSTLLYTDNRGMCQACHQW